MRTATVADVADLGPRLRRITLTGPGLAGFAAHGPTDHVKVFFPPTSDGAPALPTVRDGAWVDRGSPGLTYREYTVRTHAPGAGAVVLDMTAHAHGPAGRWVAQAAPGQQLALLGPKTSKLPPLDRPWYLLAADESGLPALLNWLDRLPAGTRVAAFVEVDGPQDELDVAPRPGLTLTWVHRGGQPPGGTLVRDAVARAGGVVPTATGGDAADVAAGRAWAGLEAGSARALRRHLILERGLPRAVVDVTGYWRAGVAHFDHKSAEATA